MEKRRTELTAVITGVTSKEAIMAHARELGLNPQEIFVRVIFKLGEDEYTSSNKLRFLGKEGYTKLLEAKESGEPISITITANEKGTLLYVNSDAHVEIDDLFSTPVERVDNRKNIEDLF